jgi:hypothetical protein
MFYYAKKWIYSLEPDPYFYDKGLPFKAVVTQSDINAYSRMLIRARRTPVSRETG